MLQYLMINIIDNIYCCIMMLPYLFIYNINRNNNILSNFMFQYIEIFVICWRQVDLYSLLMIYLLICGVFLLHFGFLSVFFLFSGVYRILQGVRRRKYPRQLCYYIRTS